MAKMGDVQIAYPQPREVTEFVIASGNFRTHTLANVGSEVTETVENVLVDEGDRVKAGQVLVTLERSDIEQQLRQARLAAARPSTLCGASTSPAGRRS